MSKSAERFLELLGKLPTTQATCAVGLLLAVMYVVGAFVAALVGHEIGEHTLDTIGLFIASMMGIGGLTFAAKRFSDSGYATAKATAAANATIPPGSVVIPSQQTTVQPAPTNGGERGS
jgi:hypothetical protein